MYIRQARPVVYLGRLLPFPGMCKIPSTFQQSCNSRLSCSEGQGKYLGTRSLAERHQVPAPYRVHQVRQLPSWVTSLDLANQRHWSAMRSCVVERRR